MSKNRSIFEEVDSDAADKPVAQPGLIDRTAKGARGAIRLWLMIIFALVAVMILVGGLTRLTDSGLSITEWRPLTGAIPPMNDADWQAEFAKYQEIPEFQLQNAAMDLAAFKSIYWWEWGHRQLGRVIGLVWGAGFLFFWLTKRIPTGWTPRLLGLGALGGLQGAIGWWMVSSGLTGRMVDVASYRLAIHLGLAFVILGLTVWYIFSLSRSEAALMQARRGRDAKLFSMSTGFMHFAMLQIVLGALVAGIDAGRDFPSWPLMNGSFFPPDAFYVADGGATWRAFFENAGLVQFMHRMAGYLLIIFGVVVWRRSRSSGNDATRGAFSVVTLMLLLQMGLGIATVVMGASLQIALLHQLGAIITWVLILRARHMAQYPIEQSIRGAKT